MPQRASAAQPAGEGLPRQARITAAEEIRALLRRGKRRKTRHLDVFASASPLSHARWGVIVPKPRAKTQGKRRIGGAAVQRNRLKRRLKEIGRTLVLPRLNGAGRPLDVLVRARPEAYRAEWAELREQLATLVEELCSGAR